MKRMLSLFLVLVMCAICFVVPAYADESTIAYSTYTNVAVGKTVTKSSELHDADPNEWWGWAADAFDGNANTCWVLPDVNGWATVDLGAPTLISKLVYKGREGSFYGWKFQGSNDNITFTDITIEPQNIQNLTLDFDTPLSYRYIRVEYKEEWMSTKSWGGIYEVEVYTNYVNAAVGKTVTKSSELHDADPNEWWGWAADAFDGNANTCWVLPDVNGWATVDLGAPTNISRIVYKGREDSFYGWKLQGSNDNVTFTDITTEPQNIQNLTLDFDTPLSYRYIRVEYKEEWMSTKSWGGVYEVAVYTKSETTVPIYKTLVDVAKGKQATASSTDEGDPSHAVDGLTGTKWVNWASGWWQVDLGGKYNIKKIQMIMDDYSDSGNERDNYRFLASNDPQFAEGTYEILNEMGTNENRAERYYTIEVNPSKAYRYLRVDKTVNLINTRIIEFSAFAELNVAEVSRNKTATASHTAAGWASAANAVNGNLTDRWEIDLTYEDGSEEWWNVDLGGSFYVDALQYYPNTSGLQNGDAAVAYRTGFEILANGSTQIVNIGNNIITDYDKSWAFPNYEPYIVGNVMSGTPVSSFKCRNRAWNWYGINEFRALSILPQVLSYEISGQNLLLQFPKDIIDAATLNENSVSITYGDNADYSFTGSYDSTTGIYTIPLDYSIIGYDSLFNVNISTALKNKNGMPNISAESTTLKTPKNISVLSVAFNDSIDGTGNEISKDISVLPNIVGVKANIVSASSVEEDLLLIVCIYDSNKTLKKIAYLPTSLAVTSEVQTFATGVDLSNISDKSDLYAKAFVWKNKEVLSPYIEAISLLD